MSGNINISGTEPIDDPEYRRACLGRLLATFTSLRCLLTACLIHSLRSSCLKLLLLYCEVILGCDGLFGVPTALF